MHRALVVTAAVWLWLSIGRCSSAGELADVAVAAHDATLQSIRDYAAKTEFRGNIIDGRPVAQFTTSYWRTPEGVRIRELRNQRTVEIISQKDRVEVMVPNSEPTSKGPATLRILPKDSFLTHADPWLFSVFALPGGATPGKPQPNYTLGEVHRLFELKEERVIREQGRDLVFLNYIAPGGRKEYRVYLDKSLNWLIVRCQRDDDTQSDLGVAHYDFTATDFIEVKPGIYAPTRCISNYRAARGPAITNEAKIEGIQINEVSIRLPPVAAPTKDLLVLDRTKGITYQANAQRQRVGKISKVGEPFNLPNAAVEHKLPPPSWTAWIVAASVATGAVAGAFAWFKLRPRHPA